MEQEIEQVTAFYQIIINFIVNYSFQIFGAVIIMIIGVLIARKLATIVTNILLRHKLDPTLSNFIASFVRIGVIAMVTIMALNKVGISITPLLAAIGALSLGAGLAMQGLVSNYGSGINIIIARPFVVGDTIDVLGVKGIVKSVHLGYTLLTDEDNVEITIPNRHIVGEVIKNSQQDTLVELTIGVSYGQPPEKAIAVINEVLGNATALNPERAYQVGINDFGDSSINLGIRFWAPTDKHYATRYQVNQAIFAALMAADITIPFPQRDVHINPQ